MVDHDLAKITGSRYIYIVITTSWHVMPNILPRAVSRGKMKAKSANPWWKQYKYMATGNYFDSNRTITEHFQIEAA
jgi:hypothetical protein